MNLRQTALLLAAAAALATAPLADAAKCTVSTSTSKPTVAPAATTPAPAATTAAPVATTATPVATTAAPATDYEEDDESDASDADDADDADAPSPTTALPSASPSNSTGSGLHVAAAAAGKYMGTASDINSGDAYYTAELANADDWGMVTPGNAMKWDSTEYTQGSFSFAKADAFVKTVQGAGMKVRCHTLCWHQQVPSWVQSLSKADMLSALEKHVTEVMTHFGDDCYAWDVVNEALAEDGSFRASFWYAATGTEYITTAFKAANAVKKTLGLRTKLYYNDYNTDRVNAKSTAALALAKMLLDQGIAIDGMGFQAHLTSGSVASTADQVANLERFTALGLDVAVTELDVKVGTAAPSDAQLQQQATEYASVVSACKQLDGCVGITTWDFSDQYSWISSDAPLPFHQPGGRGAAVQAKPAYDAMLAAWAA